MLLLGITEITEALFYVNKKLYFFAGITKNVLFMSWLCFYLHVATVSLNASKVPETPVSNNANVSKKTFHSLTFQWRGINSASSNASSVYLITLRTFNTRLTVEERVLSLVSKLVFHFNVVFFILEKVLSLEFPWKVIAN